LYDENGGGARKINYGAIDAVVKDGLAAERRGVRRFAM
jgi:hypothetical protein